MERGAALRLVGAAVLCCAVMALGACTWFQPQPETDFTLDPASGVKPMVVDFSSVVDEGALSYSWDFGDGAKSTEQAPSHIYYVAGTYTVRLSVTYEGGHVVAVEKPGCITVTEISLKEYVPNLYVLSAAEGVIQYANLDGGMIVNPNSPPPTLHELQTGIQPGDSNTHHTLAAVHGGGDTFVYWTEGTALYKKGLVSNNVNRIYIPMNVPVGLCVDSVHSKLYEVELPVNVIGSSVTGSIRRCNLDGTGLETLHTGWAFEQIVPWFVSVDPYGDRLYFVRMSYPEQSDGIIEPLAAEPKAQTTYIDATPLDSFANVNLVSDFGEAGGIAVDAGLSAGARYVYWTLPNSGRIDRCKVDGTELTRVVTGLSNPRAIAVDVGRGKLYWGDSAGVHRANLDGTGAELVYPGLIADALAIG